MGCIINFCRDMITDIRGVFNEEAPPNSQNSRITSIVLRNLGALFLVDSALSLVSGVSFILSGGTFPAVVALVSAVFDSILAHDLIKMGYNERLTFAGTFISRAGRLLHEISSVVVPPRTPFLIEGTVIVKPMYQLATSCYRTNQNSVGV